MLKFQRSFVWMVGDPVHMVKHRDAFLDSLTDEEYEIHKAEVEKGTIEKVMSVLRSKDPKKAAEDLEKEGSENE